MSNFCTKCGKELTDGEVCACQQVATTGEPKTDYTPTDFIPEPVQPVPDQPVPEQVAPPVPPVAPMPNGQAPNNFGQAPVPPVQPVYTAPPKPLLPSYDVNTFAILSITMGIIGACAWNIYLCIFAIIFSVMAKKRLRREDVLGEKFTKAGLILGIVVLGIIVIYSLVVGVALVGMFGALGSMF